MTDDERLERLTELARRKWPDAVLDTRRMHPDDQGTVRVMDGALEVLRISETRHRFDALEAALLVLVGESRDRLLIERLTSDRDEWMQRYRRAEDARCEVLAWVEELEAALKYRPVVDDYAIDGERWRELRARAKGGEHG